MEPFEVREGKVKMTFLGTLTQTRAFLRKLDKTGVPYKLLAVEDPGSPQTHLSTT
jgi:hypothetical protein